MKTVVITGANRGIGLALCQHYRATNARVIGLVREPSKKLKATGTDIISDVDVGDPNNLLLLKAKLADTLKGSTIDVLINNAGILHEEFLDSLAPSPMVQQFHVNALGPLLVTEQALGLLSQNAKVVMITSRMGSMGDNGSGGFYGYRMSKAALNAAAVSLAQDLKSQGITVAILHPGFVQTDMVDGAGNVSAEEAAGDLISQIEQSDATRSGRFFHASGEELPW